MFRLLLTRNLWFTFWFVFCLLVDNYGLTLSKHFSCCVFFDNFKYNFDITVGNSSVT